jgi:hypothetical protein
MEMDRESAIAWRIAKRRPVSEDAFLERLEAATRRLKPGRRGPKARDLDSSEQPVL